MAKCRRCGGTRVVDVQIETIETTSLGNRGYLVHDGSFAVAIDVQRDYTRWTDRAKELGVTLTHVFETHMHNDYVTGGYQLAAADDNIEYVVPANSHATFSARFITDGETITSGNLSITAIHTPGHTEHHTSYHVSDSNTHALFSGGGLLFGTVGRTDLVTSDLTRLLTEQQYESAQKLLSLVPEQASIMPTHGFGSFCSSSDGSGATESTLAEEQSSNIAYTSSKEDFISTIIGGLGPYPRYYAHMGPANQAGPAVVKDLHVHEYSTDAIRQHLHAENSWVIDIRSRTAYAAGHPERAVGIELGQSFATYTGWLIPWSDSLLLVGDDSEELQFAYTELSRIGMEQFVAGATDSMDAYQASGATISHDIKTFDDYMAERPATLIDVRLLTDWQKEHVEGSLSLPLHELMERANELPEGPIWVHCASGYRASIACSLIARSGKQPVLVNDAFMHAQELHLTTKGE